MSGMGEQEQPTNDYAQWPYHGICGKCGNYRDKLDKNCLCSTCLCFGVKCIALTIPEDIKRFVKPRF